MGEAAGNPVKTRAVAPVGKGRSVGENHKESVWEAVPERAQGLPMDAGSGNPERIGITLRGSLLLRVLYLDERPPRNRKGAGVCRLHDTSGMDFFGCGIGG